MSGDPYIIYDYADLKAVGTKYPLSANYKLANNIDASASATENSGAGFTPIGTESSRFTGSFDGNNYIIYNLHINSSATYYIGFCGCADASASIHNLGLVDITVTGNSIIGALVGLNYGYVSYCFSTGSVSGVCSVGGLIGSNMQGNVYYSFSKCHVTGTDGSEGCTGGFMGDNDLGTVSNCYSAGAVNGVKCVGGFIGNNGYGSSGGTVNYCYTVSTVSGTGYFVAAFAGGNQGSVDHCHWDIETSGGSGYSYNEASWDASNSGLTDAQMKVASSFSGWSFVFPDVGGTWSMPDACINNGYPALAVATYNYPCAITSPATNLTSSSATLNGSVFTTLPSTTVVFKYGTTSGGPYTKTVTASQSPVVSTSTSSATVSAGITGLTPGVVYYYIVSCTGTHPYVSGESRFAIASPSVSPPGKALSFNGTNQDAVCQAPPTITAPFTVEAWASANSDGQFISTRSPSDASFDMQFSSLHFHGDIGNGTSWLTTSADGGQYQLNKWYHVAYVVTTTGYTLYVNGIQQGTGTFSGTPLFSNAHHYIYVGPNFNGSVDEVRIWNTARTQDQIQSNMCKKLAGSESGLVIYWKFDEGTGTTIANSATASGYSGCTLTLENSPTWICSGAPVGDASAYDYTGTNASDFSASLASTDGDNVAATGDGGTVQGIQVYRTDATAMRSGATAPAGWTVDRSRYWGVFITGNSPTYTVTYNYNGHHGITNATTLALATRGNQSVDAWTDISATLNTTAMTLTKSGQGNAEYALASSTTGNALPVELSSFTASTANGTATLAWKTATEINNYGFEIERRVIQGDGKGEKVEWSKVGFVAGNGTSNTEHTYSYSDANTSSGTYAYRLKQIDNGGTYKYSSETEVTISIPKVFALNQNYPNPFNPTTTFTFTLAQDGFTTLKVYNVLGKEVATLVNGEMKAGMVNTVTFNASRLSSGVYFYQLKSGSFLQTKKMLLMK